MAPFRESDTEFVSQPCDAHRFRMEGDCENPDSHLNGSPCGTSEFTRPRSLLTATPRINEVSGGPPCSARPIDL
jgi:hypothetical protein